MSWRTRLGNWVKRQRKKFGLWLCKRCGHKNKRFASVDWASRGSMIAKADVCQRCGLITVVDVWNGAVDLEYKKVLKSFTIVDDVGNVPDIIPEPPILKPPNRMIPSPPFNKSDEESTPGSLCKHWDGWYCTAPEVESETIHGCEGLLINCNNPKHKIGGD